MRRIVAWGWVSVLAVGFSVDARTNEATDRLVQQAERSGILNALEKTPLGHAQRQRVAVAIVREARHHGLDPLLVVALIQAESSFLPKAVSPVGAMGLMQIMPATGRWLLAKRGQELAQPAMLFDVDLNIQLGTAYLADLIARFGSIEAALVAYNAGPGKARKILAEAEKKRLFIAGYPKKVLRNHALLRSRLNSAGGPARVAGGR